MKGSQYSHSRALATQAIDIQKATSKFPGKIVCSVSSPVYCVLLFINAVAIIFCLSYECWVYVHSFKC